MNLLELFPEATTWNLNQLIIDINAARQKLDNKGELSEMNKYYLYGVLVGHTPKDISHKLGLSRDGKVRTALCDEINPYIHQILNYPNDLQEKMNWQRACVLLEKAGYKRNISPQSSQDSSVTKIKLDSDNPSMADLEAILAKIRKMTEDESITIQDIRRGCIELVLSGSPFGLKRLEYLIKSGELQDIAGIIIISAESGVEPNKVVRLSNWLDNLVESGWQTLEQLLNFQQLEIVRNTDIFRSNATPKGKLIDRKMLKDGFAVVLTVGEEQLDDGFVEITLRIYATDEQMYLSSGIKLRMFGIDENGDEFTIEKQADSEDEWVELPAFKGKVGEEFSVEIVKGDISVVENFII
jgi:hypothetical protein